MTPPPAESQVDFRKELILASALLHTAPPDDQVHANCARVLRHALMAAGLWDVRHEKNQAAIFHGLFDDFPAVGLWYMTLLEMTGASENERLLEGAGNIRIPAQAAGPSFTACWLTPLGQAVAARILAGQPDLRAKLLQHPLSCARAPSGDNDSR